MLTFRRAHTIYFGSRAITLTRWRKTDRESVYRAAATVAEIDKLSPGVLLKSYDTRRWCRLSRTRVLYALDGASRLRIYMWRQRPIWQCFTAVTTLWRWPFFPSLIFFLLLKVRHHGCEVV